MRHTQGCLYGLHASETDTTRPKILHIPLGHHVQELHPGCPAMRCDTGNIAQHWYTWINQNPSHLGPPTDADPGRTSYATPAAASVHPLIGLDPMAGARSAPLSVRFDRFGASRCPHARCPASAATAAAAGTLAAAAETTAAAATTTAAAASAAATATRCHCFSLPLVVLAGASAAAVPPSAYAAKGVATAKD